MNAIWTVAKREVHSFFLSPIAYVVLTVWLLVCGGVFSVLAFFFASQPPGQGGNLLTGFFGGTTLFYIPLLVFAPVLTMRLLAEEKNTGTIEMLMTAPVTDAAVVLGKYLAALTFWVTLWLPTLAYVFILSDKGDDAIDWGALGSTYLGLFCIGVFYMAVGLLMSAVSRNQIVAAILTFLVLGGLFIVGLAGYAATDPVMRSVFEYLSVWSQMSAFAKGIVDTRYLVFDFSVAAMCVFMAVRAMQDQRWQ